MSTKPGWLNQAVFYEVYPQSFMDMNGDGIGDIPGIIAKLDYLNSLGVNAVWINPCFDSPFYDAGYDIRDYYHIAPRYGTNGDLKVLIDEARAYNIRILLDLVPGHTSIEHPWFIESCKHVKNQFTDWYIWTDSAWKWDVPGFRVISGMAERDGSYITNFFYSQPSLNYGFANPDPSQHWQQPTTAPGPQAVRAEIRKIMKYWLELGVSGFRVDMAGWLVKGDPSSQGTLEFWREIRAWLDIEYPDACLISEWGNPSLAISGGFHADFCLPFGMPGYTSIFRKPYGPGAGSDPYGESFFSSSGHGNVQEFLDNYQDHYQKTKQHGVIIIPTGNHDINPRLSKGRSEEDLKVVFTFIMTMPGSPIIYYGDEIGMRTIDGLPSKEGGYNRTGSRTPMQWSSLPNAGFSTALQERLYLPIDPDEKRPNVLEQENRPNSLLNHVRGMIHLRKSNSAFLAESDFSIVHAGPFTYPLIYLRKSNDQSALVAINPSAVSFEVPLSLDFSSYKTLFGNNSSLVKNNHGWMLKISGISSGVFEIHN